MTITAGRNQKVYGVENSNRSQLTMSGLGQAIEWAIHCRMAQKSVPRSELRKTIRQASKAIAR